MIDGDREPSPEEADYMGKDEQENGNMADDASSVLNRFL